ncbi:MAG: biopolymer transporter ExbD [candidate division KSB1 bacterium]|nr:biopolymer transporter ExbD [candidate division KSB1 bacterium]MDZ7273063.1 biopolymer transporter ExbD [candidate division KSB1 bacterium]MDZ7285166.1 biopolymer transporter ExbD [candidate division KSB1 bacterium]MDZ7298198.1 biopolymer transporter ExbD [candidate division KSB1 bacterium]MDZ7306872.1 biopolymer transporter ExbD [candidate division KSB1 bacterium]
MAFRPSQRRHLREESTDLNLTPIMNLMVVMIPLLLSSAQFIKIGIIELNLPPAAGAAGTLAGSKAPKETERTLDLTVSITDQGFYISSAAAVLTGATATGPTIPIGSNGEYNFDALSQKLYEIKQKVGNGFSDAESIVIQAENKIRYQVLVSTMDAARSIRVNGTPVLLFPQVSLSAGII